VPGVEIEAICKAARSVSGDYYDFIQLSPNAYRYRHRRYLREGDFRGTADGQSAGGTAQPDAYGRQASA